MNRWYSRSILKMSRDEAGRAVQKVGAATLKALLRATQCPVWGMESRPVSEARRFRDGVYGLRRLERF